MSEQIFISYSHKDHAFVGRLSTALSGQGYSVWFDQRTLEVGERWREEIVAGIKECEAFVLVLSEESVESADVAKELSLAEGFGRRIFPVMVGEVEISDRLAYALAGIQYQKFQAGEDEAALERLVRGLESSGLDPAETVRSGQLQGPCLGREPQLDSLMSAVRGAVSGRGGVRFVVGEAGAGKTVLVQEALRRAVGEHKHLVAGLGATNPRTGLGDPYLPFREVLGLLIGDVASSTAAAGVSARNASRVRDRLVRSTELLLEHAPDLVGMLAPGADLVRVLEGQEGADAGLVERVRGRVAARQEGGADLDQDRIHLQATALLRALAAEGPLLLVLEDLQWADDPSIELLSQLAVRLATSPVLILGTYRPFEVASGRDGQRHPLEPVLNGIKQRLGDVWIDLSTEEKEQARAFIDALVDEAPNRLDEPFRDALLQRTGGNALFATELLDNLRQRGALELDAEGRWVTVGEVQWDELPARTEAVIEERVARLGEQELAILELASVEGPSFTAEALARIRQMQDADLVRTLSRELGRRRGLVEAEGVERRGAQWLSHYRFLQASLQSYLYGTLDPREKMLFHDQIGRALSQIFEGHTEELAPQLAWHFDRAGDAEQAIHYALIAARRALMVSGYGEAQRHLDRALDLLEQLSPGRPRSETELEIQSLRGVVLKVRKGWASKEVKAAYDRGRELGAELGPHPQLASILFGLWAYHLVRLELAAALDVAEECRKLAETLEDDDGLVQAEVAKGNTLYWRGDLAGAKACMLEALDRFHEKDSQAHLLRHGQDSRVLALMFLSLIASIAGELGEAEELDKRMLELAREIDHPFTTAIALQGAAWSQFHQDKPALAEVYSEQLVQITREHNFPYYLGVGMMIHGWAVGVQGDGAGGLDELDQGFEEHLAAVGGRLFHSVYCLLRAQALERAGEIEAALATVDRGLEVARECHEIVYLSELLRMEGNLRGHGGKGDRARAIESVEAAVEAAQRQGARTFELRAERVLARLRIGAPTEGGTLAIDTGATS